MDLIDEILTDASLNKEDYAPSIRAACGMGKKTLNKYYNKTDNSEMYRIAMSKSSLSITCGRMLIHSYSLTSRVQAPVLQECEVAACLDQDRRGALLSRVQAQVCAV